MEEDWKGAVDSLRSAGRVAVACHVNPDGDALGSLFATALALKKLGKQVWPSWGTEGADVPEGYRFLPGSDLFVPSQELPDADVFVALDCGDINRLDALKDKATRAPVLINMDHHPGNSNFGTYNIVVTTASSTAELVARLIRDLGVDIDESIASCLYTGILTDTDRLARIWADCRDSPEHRGPDVWIHADLMPGNLLLRDGRLAAVIDLGAVCAGDPAVDLMPAWNLFGPDARTVYRRELGADDAMWARGRGWAIVQAIGALPYYVDTNPVMAETSRRTLHAVLDEAGPR